MPRNVRNFWIKVRIDGRQSDLSGGPRTKDGGFILDIYMRDEGSDDQKFIPVTIVGKAYGDRLVLKVECKETPDLNTTILPSGAVNNMNPHLAWESTR